MWPWSERTGAGATTLTLEELLQVRPHHVRGPFPRGERAPVGERPGRGRAPGLDFDGISPYVHGDDVRWIDWRATARSTEVQVRRFAAQSHRARMIVLDLHAEFYFATRRQLMAKTAVLVAARLAWESLALNEPVGLVLPDGPDDAMRPRRGRGQLLRLLASLHDCYRNQEGMPPSGRLAGDVTRAADQVRHGDEVCVVSDFAGPLEPLLAATRSRAAGRSFHALVVDDYLGRSEVPAGRYPARRGPLRQVFAIDRQAAAAAAETADRHRSMRRRQLVDGGWQVIDALDWLPEVGAWPT